MNKLLDNETLKPYPFERLIHTWEKWYQKNAFYHQGLQTLIRRIIPPGMQVLQLDSKTGDLLAALRPSRGIGLNVSSGFTDLARRKYPHLEFYTLEGRRVKLPEGFAPDYILLSDMLDYSYDVWNLLEDLKPVMNDGTLLVITTSNPLWAPLLRLASLLGQRVPDSPRNFVTNRDLQSVLELQGLDVVELGMALPIPRCIPLISTLLNMVLPEVPGLRYASSVQYLTGRPRVSRPLLSCSVVIPCHDEEANVVECIQRVPAMGTWTEIVVVDDCSNDHTRSRVQEAARRDPRVRLIALDRHEGKANAVRLGFEAARGDVVMILDADMAVAPEELPKFFQPLQHGTADVINGTRLVYPMEGQAMKFTNFLGNKAFCFLVSWILRQRVSDTLCGTKALLRRDALMMSGESRERWGDFNLLFEAARLRLRIKEIPVHYRERLAGKSKMRAMRDGWLFLIACWCGWRRLRLPGKVLEAQGHEVPIARRWREVKRPAPGETVCLHPTT